jgi:hypothetical protein
MPESSTEITVIVTQPNTTAVTINDRTPINILVTEKNQLNFLFSEKQPIDVSLTSSLGTLDEESVPQSSIINRVDNEISSIDFAAGRTVTINRINGEIVSVDDGIYLKTINRTDGEITGITVT